MLVACSPGSTTWDRISDEGVLRVGLDPTYLPFEVDDGNGLWGLDVDLARSLGEELNLEVEFTYFGFDGLYDALLAGHVDLLISALAVTPEKTKDFAYSLPYFDAGQVLIYPAARGPLALEELDGAIVAVEVGSEGHLQATNLRRSTIDLEILALSTIEEAIETIYDGQADAAIVDHVGGRLAIADRGGDLIVGPNMISSEPYAIVVRREDETLLRVLNESLTSLRDSGQLSAIISQWLGE